MLSVFSDLHLPDGTCSKPLTEVVVCQLREQLISLFRRGGWRSKRNHQYYQPVSVLDVVLLGDVFDLIRSTLWSERGIYPWSPQNDAFYDVVRDISEGIIGNNASLVALMKELSQGVTVTVPGKGGRETHQAKVRWHYMVGNHDWCYRLVHPKMDAVRQTIADALGLCFRPGDVFPHDLIEAPPELQTVCTQHRVWCRHADVFDDINFDKERGRNFASFGDAIVVKLINRLPTDLQEALGLPDDHPLIVEFKQIDHVRPVTHVPDWIYQVAHRYSGMQANLDKVLSALWRKRIESFLDTDFVREGNHAWLKALLSCSSRIPVRALRGAVRLGSCNSSYLRHAWQEYHHVKGGRDFIVYGHTHHPQRVTLAVDRYCHGAACPVKVYFNYGTMKPLVSRVAGASLLSGYTQVETPNMLAFFKEGEALGLNYWFSTSASG